MIPPKRVAAAVAIGFAVCLLCSGALAGPVRGSRALEAERHYRMGIAFYVRGDRAQALASFHKALSLDPANDTINGAIHRLSFERETLPQVRDPDPTLGADWEEMLDEHLPLQVLSFLRFERTLGDARSDQGTLAAMQGRVAQMLAERERARARGQAFVKEHELRALVRRLAAVKT